MSQLPRIIVPGVAHHVTQRGNRRQRVFLIDDDYALYKDWLAQSCQANGVAVWSYCFMPNRVHLILVPSDDSGSMEPDTELEAALTRGQSIG